jgi:hypothetical protein
MTDSEVTFAATHLIDRLGPNAINMAARTAAAFDDDGFSHLARNWRRIATAIKRDGEHRSRKAG